MIEIPGHEIIVQNAVYCRPTSNYENNYVVILNTYQQLNNRDVFDYLCESVLFWKGLQKTEPETELELLISQIPENIQKRFLKKDESLFEEMEDYLVSDAGNDLPSRWLEVHQGIVSKELIKENGKNLDWYYDALSSQVENDESTSFLALNLDGDGYFPPRDLVTDFIVYGSDQSRVHVVRPSLFDSEHIMDLVNTIYDFLEPKDLEQLKPFNNSEDHAISSLKNFLDDINPEIKYDYLRNFSLN